MQTLSFKWVCDISYSPLPNVNEKWSYLARLHDKKEDEHGFRAAPEEEHQAHSDSDDADSDDTDTEDENQAAWSTPKGSFNRIHRARPDDKSRAAFPRARPRQNYGERVSTPSHHTGFGAHAAQETLC